MAKRKTKPRRRWFSRIRRRRGKPTVPVAPILGLSVGFLTRRPDWGASPVELMVKGDWNMAFESLKQSYLGIMPDGSFNPALMQHGLLPLALGLCVHKFIGGSPLNFNRVLAKAKVPYIRI